MINDLTTTKTVQQARIMRTIRQRMINGTSVDVFTLPRCEQVLFGKFGDDFVEFYQHQGGVAMTTRFRRAGYAEVAREHERLTA